MKKILSMTLLSSMLATPALAAEKSGSIGANISLDGALGLQAEFALQKPFSLQLFLKNYSRYYDYGNNFGRYSYSYTAVGAAALYDFSKEIKLSDKKLHPYVGLGLYTVSASFNGSGGYIGSSVSTGLGLYLTLGVKYDITPTIDLDTSYNSFGGLTVGANVKF
jgi:hypothetical protein